MAESQFKRFGLPRGPSSGNRIRAAHLKRLNDMRQGREDQPQKLDFGAVLLSIPELDYQILLHRFPDLNSRDAETKTRAWKKFARDSASLPYRTK